MWTVNPTIIDNYPNQFVSNTMSGLEISSKIIDSLLAAKETGEKIHLEFFKKRVTITQG